MAKAHCPEPGCPGDDGNGLVTIMPTDELRHTNGSSKWWKTVPHWVNGKFCNGSNKRV